LPGNNYHTVPVISLKYGFRGGSRIFGKGRLIQGTKLLGGDVLQHAKHAGTRGVWGHALPGKIFKIDVKILQFRDISTCIK